MKKLVVFAILIALSEAHLWAVGSGAFGNQVVGTKALGMGNTFVATADDPSAVFFNPAGLTQINSPSISLGVTPLLFNTNYKSDPGTKEEAETQNPIIPNLYITSPFMDNKWALGFGIYTPYGLKTKWKEDGLLRYIATESELQVLHFNPTISYQINDKFSVGGGAVYERISADLKSRLNLTGLNSSLRAQLSLPPVISPDGGKRLEGDGEGWGYNIGLLYVPVKEHRFGFSYRSEIKSRLEGTTQLSYLSDLSEAVFGGTNYNINTRTDFDIPQSIMIGYAFAPGNWTFEVDTEWVDYSKFDKTLLSFMGESDATRLSILDVGNPINRKWNDTWNFGWGANYKFNETWQARGGYYLYPNVIPESTWDPSIPEGTRNGFTLGGSFKHKAFIIDLAYNFLYFAKRTIHNNIGVESLSTVNGEYKSISQAFSMSITYNFK